MDKANEKAASIIADAGGTVVGRTRLQKIAYLLELAGMGDGFKFEYRHYGPYSEDLSHAVMIASLFDMIHEEEKKAQWGGIYSIYSLPKGSPAQVRDQRKPFAQTAAGLNSISLELAATAAYLSAVEHYIDPWEETAVRKPEKASPERLLKAKDAYRILLDAPGGKKLPAIV